MVDSLFIVRFALVAIFVGGCAGKNTPQDGPVPAPTPVEAKPAVVTAPAVEEARLAGTVILKPWTKSAESWNAGGAEYYVLDVGDAPVKTRTAKEGVLLRPSAQVTAEDFGKWVNKPVVVTGTYVAGKTPEIDPNVPSQIRTGSDGRPAPVGAGFKVSSIKAD